MSKPIHSLRRIARSAQHQRGVYALEWAVIFVVFFMLLYAIISFGLAFLVRQSMQWAVEDGARAALQQQTSRQIRKEKAQSVIANNLAWLPGPLRTSIQQSDNFSFKVCKLGNVSSCTEDMSASALICDVPATTVCMIQVQLKLAYAKHSFTPSITMGLMELAMPNLQANAQIVVDQRGF